MIIVGDSRIELCKLKDVQTIVTSPPYWDLRDYGSKAQVGFGQSLDAYIDDLVNILDSSKNCLNPQGSMWVNLGDKYDKGNLIGLPYLIAFALKSKGWILRQAIIWAKPNPMPESTKNRCSRSYEHFFHFTRQMDYYYDNQSIKEPAKWFGKDRRSGQGRFAYKTKFDGKKANGQQAFVVVNEMRNKRDVWTIATKPFKGAHYAVMPEALIEPAILSTSKEGDLIVDPFAGSGTVGLVAGRLKRPFIGIELNEDYAELAKNRINTNKSCLK
jgi:DNA modification methylase